ncbi:MAG TPA: hypothetical protein PK677_05065 [Acidiphilium sp.]|nr:MAG: hypothetical protein B7Z67_04980 [Acidiphilium sp. 21-60-14]OYV92479.1 MAG: hypothetical protein B7Z57_00145 [Acidiphilium sp. 37-60-79]OZB40931.1 MAG: hypothetical protein B7X48_02465 [Acidiphilium sp. 34-60-192]HQT87907.1 hypothetical protein [Acidiphilium sp.]HQU22678.1 hypothetical protein [Acidiphilium sp.]
MTADQRISITFGGPVRAADAVLMAGDAPAPLAAVVERFSPIPVLGHRLGCSCCAPRNQAALALNRLFLARARGAAPWFKRLVFIGNVAAQAELRAALADDLLSRARFILADSDVTDS